MLNVLAGYDKLDIASVEHPKEDYVAAMKQPVSGLRLGFPRAPFFDLLDADVAKAVKDAIGVLAKMTKGMKDVALPSTANVILGGESYAYHENAGRAALSRDRKGAALKSCSSPKDRRLTHTARRRGSRTPERRISLDFRNGR